MSAIFKIKPLLLLCLLATTVLVVNSCKKDDDTSNTIQLNSFGPSPVLRGGDLKFIGQNLDKVTAIVLANNVSVTSFKSQSAELLTIVVPQETVEGFVTLKTPQGDITTKTKLSISEPISISSFSPAQARPGDVVTINGEYLNLIKSVQFSNKKSVASTAFVSQTRQKIEVKVPEDAQSGKFLISNGAAEAIEVESETELLVTLPAVSSLAPAPVKAGTELTIQGSDLDLVKKVSFNGGSNVTTFNTQEAGKITLNVPADGKDGAIKLTVASLVEVTSTQEVVMKVPTINTVTPNPAKNGTELTVTGADLDLITKATFGGNKDGQLQGGTATQITVKVPIDATDGSITFTTAAGKTVSSGSALSMIKPVISGIAPTDVQFNTEITISGSDLDLVSKVKFNGTEATPTSATATEVKVSVPVGTQAGAITLVTTNGSEITSTQSLTILASTNATITGMPTMAKPGEMIEIYGINLEEVTEIIFPIDVPATMYGIKSSTLIQVVIPQGAKTGLGTLRLITATGEEIISPQINIQGVDPVTDPTLVFFNFEDLSYWWNDAGAVENDPALSLNGTSYFHVNKDCNGWTGLFWRNGSNNFPGATINTDVANFVLKFDVNVLEPITGGEFAWRLKGSAGDFWYRWKPWESTGSYQTSGWITITIPVNQFSDGTNFLSDLSTITEDFGVAFNAGSSKVNVCIDNVRFEHL